jgi:hypothetical protein
MPRVAGSQVHPRQGDRRRALDELTALRRRLQLVEDLRDPTVFDFGTDPDELRASGWR